jgi:hypothetical protein
LPSGPEIASENTVSPPPQWYKKEVEFSARNAHFTVDDNNRKLFNQLRESLIDRR